MSSIDKIVNLIQICGDLDTITVGTEKYTDCSLKGISTLSQWLYCVLHTRHPELLNENSLSLTDDIKQAVSESSIILKGEAQNIFDINTVNVGGIRVYTNHISDEITVSKLRPNLTPGFFLYMNSVADGKILVNTERFYIYSKDAPNAIVLWKSIINRLEKLGVPFTTKVLSNASSYPRSDAIVVYSTKHDSNTVENVIMEITKNIIEDDGQEHISPLCKKLSNVVSFAEQPEFKGKVTSFGEDRCEAIAHAIMDSISSGLDFKPLLKKRLENYKINPERIYLNL